MKYIKKRKEPAKLRAWKKNTAAFADACYGNHGFPVAEVNAALVSEQGNICAYTMIAITETTSHNEHLKPQTLSKHENKLHETTDYNNLVACYPKTSDISSSCPYGADKKGNTYDSKLLVSPLRGDCERRFCFNSMGEISAYDKNDEAAKWTIEKLSLDNKALDALRYQAIVSEGLTPLSMNPLTAIEARELANRVCKRNANGLFTPFCVAIQQVALEYATKLEMKKKQRQYQSRARQKVSKDRSL